MTIKSGALLNYITSFLVVVLTFLFSCESEVQTQDDTPVSESESINNDSVTTGIPFDVSPIVLDPDTLSPAIENPLGDPIIQDAQKNIITVGQPILKLADNDPPSVIVGQGNTELPVITEATGMKRIYRYQNPEVGASNDFKDAAAYNIQGIDVDQGIGSSYVMSLIEDNRGNIWMATWAAGVSMYNGKYFTYFNESNGLISNYIWDLHQDKKGNIWFGSDGRGACKYDGETFTWYSTEHGLSSDLVLAIDEDEYGNIWFATGDGITKYDGISFEIYQQKQGLNGEKVNSIYVDHNNTIWLAMDGRGISKFEPSMDNEGGIFTHYTTKEGLISNNTTCIYEDSEDNIWIGTANSGVCMFDGYSFITYQNEQGLGSNSVLSIIEDDLGSIWFGTDGGGASKFNRFSFVRYTQNEGMSNNIIRSMIEDSDGNIWFGTYGAGANVYNGRSFENFAENQGLTSHIVRGICEDRQGNLWFAQNTGISIYDKKNFIHYGVEQGLGMNTIRAVHQDGNGDIWLATNGAGVDRLELPTENNPGRITHFTTDNGMSSDVILCISEDLNGKLWFGTFGGGVTMYDHNNFYHYTEEQGLGNNTVRTIIEDLDGNIWIGTNGGGVDKLELSADGYSGTMTHITSNEGLSDNYVLSLLQDSEEKIWIGTEGSGLNLMVNDTIINFSTDDGLSNNIVWSIVEDGNKNLWVGTEQGLNVLTPVIENKYRITSFRKSDGLKGEDFYPNSVCLDGENKLWWGSGKALTMLDLNKYERINKPPKIEINDIHLMQSFVDFRRVKDSTSKGHSYFLGENDHFDLKYINFDTVQPFSNCPVGLELPYNINHLTFYFSAIDWSSPHKIKYTYKMEGLDEEWSPLLQENRAIYSNIPYGHYTFKLKAIGESNLWSNVIELPIVIRPPWWLTWWAYCIYALVGIGFFLIIIRFRTKRLIDKQKKLEKTVSERTVELVKQKELVEHKNKEITASINYARRIQTAILPSNEFITSHFPDSFVLYRPKDIVAGDFYWLEVKNGKFLFAAADCTGHGVPGAMVSVVCNNALTRAVREFNLDEPAAILTKVRSLVIETFEKSGAEVKDGMDIALISYDPENNTLEYSGANNNMFIFTKGEKSQTRVKTPGIISFHPYLRYDVDMVEIKADKQPIGKFLVERPFRNYRVNLTPGDTIYIFTDGYIDQFGGEKNKKFKYRPFMDLLASIQHLPLTEQKEELDKAYLAWKRNLPQIDDICVIGVKF